MIERRLTRAALPPMFFLFSALAIPVAVLSWSEPDIRIDHAKMVVGEPNLVQAINCDHSLWIFTNAEGAPLSAPIVKTGPEVRFTAVDKGVIKMRAFCFRPKVAVFRISLPVDQWLVRAPTRTRFDEETQFEVVGCQQGSFIVANYSGSPLPKTVYGTFSTNPYLGSFVPTMGGTVKLEVLCHDPVDSQSRYIDVDPDLSDTAILEVKWYPYCGGGCEPGEDEPCGRPDWIRAEGEWVYEELEWKGWDREWTWGAFPHFVRYGLYTARVPRGQEFDLVLYDMYFRGTYPVECSEARIQAVPITEAVCTYKVMTDSSGCGDVGWCAVEVSGYREYCKESFRGPVFSISRHHLVFLPFVGRDLEQGTVPSNHAPYMPSGPLPSDGATDQSVDVDLNWTGGDPDGDAVTYDVYLEAGGTTPDVLVCDDTSTTACDPGTLNYDTHYYWKVVARDEHGATTTGPIWDFVTESAPNDPPNGPSSPSPSDGATDQSVDVDLNWTGGDPDDDLVTYDVFLEAGDTTPDVLVCDDTSTTACDPGTLHYDTQYYWQVIAEDEHGATSSGGPWGFQTGPMVTWESPIQLTNLVYESRYPDIQVDGTGNIHVVWRDFYPDNRGPDIFYKKRAGTSWEDYIRLTPETYPSDSGSKYPQLTSDTSNNVHVFWRDDRDADWELYYSKLNSSGTVVVDQKRITADDGQKEQWHAVVADASDNLHLVWEHRNTTTGEYEVHYAKLDNAGNILFSRIVSSDSTKGSYFPKIAVDANSNIHIVFEKETGTPATREVYYSRWDSNGNQIGSMIAVSDQDGHPSVRPNIIVDDEGNIHVFWKDERDGVKVYWSMFNSAGATLVDDTSISDASDSNKWPTTAVGGTGNIYLAWEDDRDGNQDIYFNLYDGSSWVGDVRVADSVHVDRDPELGAGSVDEIYLIYDAGGEIYFIEGQDHVIP